jgi:heptosyltransferase-2
MKLLVELPTWLGDAVMATPALENLYAAYPEAEITLVGSYVATEALRAHPRVGRIVEDRTKAGGFRPFNLLKLARELGPHDLALSFRSHLYSKALLHLTGSKKIYQFTRHSALDSQRPMHQVEKYQALVNTVTGRDDTPGPLRLDWPARKYPRPALGINPGATYGSAKRWVPERFAETAAAFSEHYEILVFGGAGEKEIADDIERALRDRGVERVRNLAGKTTIPELCSAVGGLDLFLTGDSGPMHIAAAYRVPTVALFGPTKHRETCQWMNEKSLIIRKEMECAPCMKRTCPLKHHACMMEITPREVMMALRELGKANPR